MRKILPLFLIYIILSSSCKDNDYTESPPSTNNLMISILGITNNNTFKNELKFKVQTNSKYLDVIKVYINKSLIAESTDSTGFEVTINTLKLEDGDHIIEAEVVEKGGNTRMTSVPIKIENSLIILSEFYIVQGLDTGSIIITNKEGRIIHRSSFESATQASLKPYEYNNDETVNVIFSFKDNDRLYINAYLNIKRGAIFDLTTPFTNDNNYINIHLKNVPTFNYLKLSNINLYSFFDQNSNLSYTKFGYLKGTDVLVRINKSGELLYNTFAIPSTPDMNIDMNQVNKKLSSVIIPTDLESNSKYVINGVKELGTLTRKFFLDDIRGYKSDKINIDYPGTFFPEYHTSFTYTLNNEVFSEIKVGDPINKISIFKPSVSIISANPNAFKATFDGSFDQFGFYYKHLNRDILLNVVGPANIPEFKLPELPVMLGEERILFSDFKLTKSSYWDHVDFKQDQKYFQYFNFFPIEDFPSRPSMTLAYNMKNPFKNSKGFSKLY